MTVVNVRELHERTGALVDLAAEGHVVVVTKRGVPLVELRPTNAQTHALTLPDMTAFLARFPQLDGDSSRFLEEDRS